MLENLIEKVELQRKELLSMRNDCICCTDKEVNDLQSSVYDSVLLLIKAEDYNLTHRVKEDEKPEIHLDVINEDGTTLDDYPKNPLILKWDTMVPKQCGDPSVNYACVQCYNEKCYHSNGFIMDEEDKEEYQKYRDKISAYDKLHNPWLY